MGETTGIAWTDMTFNPWIGCTKVSAGCTNCYAERENKHYNWIDKWGKGRLRKRTSINYWDKVPQWNAKARKDGVVRRVFCGSLCDVLDDEVCEEWRTDLWRAIDLCSTNLEWLLLTKREYNISKMIPREWLDGKNQYVRLGVTAENQEMYNKRVSELLKYKINNFISIEPMIGPVNLTNTFPVRERIQFLRWVIAGAESGPNARPMKDDWVRSVRDQCIQFGIPFFYKQQMVNGKMVHLPELDGKQWIQFPKL